MLRHAGVTSPVFILLIRPYYFRERETETKRERQRQINRDRGIDRHREEETETKRETERQKQRHRDRDDQRFSWFLLGSEPRPNLNRSDDRVNLHHNILKV